MSTAKLAGIISAAFVGIILFTSCWTTVSPGHRGVVIRLGAVQPRILGEGFHWIAPFITDIEEVSVKVEKDEVDASAASEDLQTVNVNLAINWHLNAKEVNTIFQTIGNRRAVVDKILDPAVKEVFKAAAAKYSAENILKQRAKLKAEVDISLTERLGRFGIVMDAMSIVDISFGKEFTKAIEAKQVAEQEAQKAVYVAQQAEQEALAEVNRAKGRAESQKVRDRTLTKAILLDKAIEKWDGKFPLSMSESGAALPFLDLGSLSGAGR